MTVVERCVMASECPPSEWLEELLWPIPKEPVSIFGHNQTAMCRDFSIKLTEALVLTNLCESLGDARRAIKGNGIRLNSQRVTDTELVLTKEHALTNIDAIVLERGKFNFGIIELC